MSKLELDDSHFDPRNWPVIKGNYQQRDVHLLQTVGKEYGLSPMMKEISMLRGNILITAAGLQKIAVNHPDYDGLEVEPIITDWEKNVFVIKAKVWKKGCAHPFEDYGDADGSTSQMKGRAMFRHAITRARSRAIKTAFGIPLLTLEELADSDIETASTPTQHRQPHPRTDTMELPNARKTHAPPVNTPTQNDKMNATRKPPPNPYKQVFAEATRLGWKGHHLYDIHQIESIKELSPVKLEDLTKKLGKLDPESFQTDCSNVAPIQELRAICSTGPYDQVEKKWQSLQDSWDQLAANVKYTLSELRYQYYFQMIDAADAEVLADMWAIVPGRYKGLSAMKKFANRVEKIQASKMEKVA